MNYEVNSKFEIPIHMYYQKEKDNYLKKVMSIKLIGIGKRQKKIKIGKVHVNVDEFISQGDL